MASKVHPRPKPPQRPPGAPVRIPTPQGRLDSIRNPQPRPRPAAEIPKECTNPECPESDVINEDSKLLCNTCGTVLQDFNMVTEVSYGIASGGQHVVHGHHVGADQAYARNADAMGRSRVMDSRELTASLGKSFGRLIVHFQDSRSFRTRLYSSYRYVAGYSCQSQRYRRSDF